MDDNGILEQDECLKTISNLLYAREYLVDFNAVDTKTTSSILNRGQPVIAPRQSEKARQLRLEQMWRMNPTWKGFTVSQCLEAEAHEIVTAMWKDMCSKGEKTISKDMLAKWTKAGNANAERLLKTFHLFHFGTFSAD